MVAKKSVKTRSEYVPSIEKNSKRGIFECSPTTPPASPAAARPPSPPAHNCTPPPPVPATRARRPDGCSPVGISTEQFRAEGLHSATRKLRKIKGTKQFRAEWLHSATRKLRKNKGIKQFRQTLRPHAMTDPLKPRQAPPHDAATTPSVTARRLGATATTPATRHRPSPAAPPAEGPGPPGRVRHTWITRQHHPEERNGQHRSRT